jgi:hypothetical protein
LISAINNSAAFLVFGGHFMAHGLITAFELWQIEFWESTGKPG